MSRKKGGVSSLHFDITSHRKHGSVNPLLVKPGSLKSSSLKRSQDALAATDGLPMDVKQGAEEILKLSSPVVGPKTGVSGMDLMKMGGKKRMVLPNINDKAEPEPVPLEEEGCGSQSVEIKSIASVHSMLPAEFSELRNMMDLHRDLKQQMTKNKEQLAALGEGDSEMTELLRSQSSHVVGMMKDVLDQMESYPEALWALYGAVEAYEKCHCNMEKVAAGEEAEEQAMPGPKTLDEHQAALSDIYSHILEAVEDFLNLDTPEGHSQE